MMFLCVFSIALLLGGVVALLGGLISFHTLMDLEKPSPFECGFSPKFTTRLPFSMRFFLLALVFLIFDVELILFFPFTLSLLMTKSLLPGGFLLFGCGVLFFGLAYEWNQGSLDWSL